MYRCALSVIKNPKIPKCAFLEAEVLVFQVNLYSVEKLDIKLSALVRNYQDLPEN